jgi:hypothetical protein
LLAPKQLAKNRQRQLPQHIAPKLELKQQLQTQPLDYIVKN